MSIQKYSVMIAGHRTSISLEPEFWRELKKIANTLNIPVSELITQIDAVRTSGLSSALRVFVLTEALKA